MSVQLSTDTIELLTELDQLLYKYEFNDKNNNNTQPQLTTQQHIITTLLPVNIPLLDINNLLIEYQQQYINIIHIIKNLIHDIQKHIFLQQYQQGIEKLNLLLYLWQNHNIWHNIHNIQQLQQLYYNDDNIQQDNIDDDNTQQDDSVNDIDDIEEVNETNENYDSTNQQLDINSDDEIEAIKLQLKQHNKQLSETYNLADNTQHNINISHTTNYIVLHYIYNMYSICYTSLQQYDISIQNLYQSIIHKIQLNNILQQESTDITSFERTCDPYNLLNMCTMCECITIINIAQLLRNIQYKSDNNIILSLYNTSLYIYLICNNNNTQSIDIVPLYNNIACILCDIQQYNTAHMYYKAAVDILKQHNILQSNIQYSTIQTNIHNIQHFTTYIQHSLLSEQIQQIQQKAIKKAFLSKNKRDIRPKKDAVDLTQLIHDKRLFIQPKPEVQKVKINKTKVKGKKSNVKPPITITHNKPIKHELPLRHFIVEPNEFKLLQQKLKSMNTKNINNKR